jgi:hypothetical protein
MTSYRRIASRTLNRDIQQQDNMVTFMKPISNAIYPKYFSVPNASNNSLIVSTGSPYSAAATPQLTFDGTTLDISGDAYVSGNLQVTGDVLSHGTIQADQFLPGQVVNVIMLSNIDLGQTNITLGSTDVSTNLFSYSYTPKITNSYLLFEYQTIYYLDGSLGDSIDAYINVDDALGTQEITHTYQVWLNTTGGGSRSGTMFPITARYTNTTNVAKTIRVTVFNNSDDNLTVEGNYSSWLKITEIGR